MMRLSTSRKVKAEREKKVKMYVRMVQESERRLTMAVTKQRARLAWKHI